MQKKIFHRYGKLMNIAAIFTSLIFISAKVSSPPRIYATGVTIYDPSKAYNSFVLFSSPDKVTHLIDLDGNEVHRWPYFGFPGELIDPSSNNGKLGHVLVHVEDGEGAWGGIFNNKTIGELDWDGNIIWQWGKEAPGGAAKQNHDWHRQANGNTLALVTVEHPVLGFKKVGDQAIYEITPNGKIEWKWILSEHLYEFGIPAKGMAYLKRHLVHLQNLGVTDDFLTINNMKVLGKNHWYDNGDKRFNPENIIIDSREANFIAIIDKKSGKIIWRLGPDFPGANEWPHGRLIETKLPRPVDQISGQHDAQLIPEGLPGAGNLLVFDNQGGAGLPPAELGIFTGSRILEINPITKQIVWQYTGANSDRPVWSFSSSFISSARRLPNGNTLIDEGANGRIFQITTTGEIVWEYVNPYFAKSILRNQTVFSNWVYRAQPVPYNWVPEGTPHSEKPVKEIDITQFHVPKSQ